MVQQTQMPCHPNFFLVWGQDKEEEDRRSSMKNVTNGNGVKQGFSAMKCGDWSEGGA